MRNTVLVSLIVVLVLSVGMGLAAVAAAEKVQITFMFWGSQDYYDRYKEYKDAFEAVNPDIEVELLIQPSGYSEKLRLLMAAGTGPDTYLLDHQDVMQFVLSGWATDLSQLAKSTSSFKLSEVLPTVRSIFQYQGKEYGFANGASVNMYFFNAQMFAEAGLENPDQLYKRGAWTWEAFRAAAKKLTRLNGEGRAETLGATMHTHNALYRGWIWSNGGAEYDDVKSPTRALFDQPEAVQALAFMQDVIQRDRTVMGSTSFADSSLNSDATRAFSAGKLGMYARWVSAIPIHGKDPFQWGMAPYPKGPGPKGTPAADLTAAAFNINPATKHKEAAWRWVAFLSDTQGVLRRMEQSGGLPSRRVVSPAEIKRYQPANFINPEILFDAVEYGFSRLMSPNQADIVRAASAELNKIFNNSVAPDIGAAEATRAVNAIIAGGK